MRIGYLEYKAGGVSLFEEGNMAWHLINIIGVANPYLFRVITKHNFSINSFLTFAKI